MNVILKTGFNQRNQTKEIARPQFSFLSTVKAMGDRPSYLNKTHRFFPNKADRLFPTRPIVFSDPNKTDRGFRTRPTIFSEQDWSPFPLFRTSLPNKTDRLIRIPNVLHPTRPNVFFLTPIVFSTDDHLSEQDRLSLPNKTERLYTTRPTVFFRARLIVFTEHDRPSFAEQDRSSFPNRVKS